MPSVIAYTIGNMIAGAAQQQQRGGKEDRRAHGALNSQKEEYEPLIPRSVDPTGKDWYKVATRGDTVGPPTAGLLDYYDLGTPHQIDADLYEVDPIVITAMPRDHSWDYAGLAMALGQSSAALMSSRASASGASGGGQGSFWAGNPDRYYQALGGFTPPSNLAQLRREQEWFSGVRLGQDPLYQNWTAARTDPRKYAYDVTVGSAKGVGRNALALGNAALAGVSVTNPALSRGLAQGAALMNGQGSFAISRGPLGAPMLQVNQPDWLNPTNAIQEQWGLVGGFVTDVLAPVGPLGKIGTAARTGARTGPLSLEGIEGVVPEGIVYSRIDLSRKILPYGGQAQNEARFLERQIEHARNHPDADFEFTIVARANPGVDLDIAEHLYIQELTGGVRASRSPSVSNLKDPVGPARRPIFGLPEPRE